jgi:hypothetical protein
MGMLQAEELGLVKTGKYGSTYVIQLPEPIETDNIIPNTRRSFGDQPLRTLENLKLF